MVLTDEANIKRGIAAITERFGRIDVTVNNAGYILVGAIEELTDAEIRANFDINVFGMMNVIRAVMPAYRAQKSGRFLNISSISGSVTDPGQAIYSASKAAVIMLTEAVDDEGRDFNVRATAVCPGGLRTSFLGGSARFPEQPIADYKSVRDYEDNYRRLNQNQSGDPRQSRPRAHRAGRHRQSAQTHLSRRRQLRRHAAQMEWQRKWRRGTSCRIVRNMRIEAV